MNFGNPEENDVYYQLEKCIEGIVDACKIFDIPVISGNVSLYNQTNEGNIYPTPIIGALGLIENDIPPVSRGFKSTGDIVYLLGSSSLSTDIDTLSGSEWAYIDQELVAGKIHIDLQLEKKVQNICRELNKIGIIESAHDCSEGGIAVAISESCINGSKGITVTSEIKGSWDVALFGEEQSRILISITPSNEQNLIEICKEIVFVMKSNDKHRFIGFLTHHKDMNNRDWENFKFINSALFQLGFERLSNEEMIDYIYGN